MKKYEGFDLGGIDLVSHSFSSELEKLYNFYLRDFFKEKMSDEQFDSYTYVVLDNHGHGNTKLLSPKNLCKDLPQKSVVFVNWGFHGDNYNETITECFEDFNENMENIFYQHQLIEDWIYLPYDKTMNVYYDDEKIFYLSKNEKTEFPLLIVYKNEEEEKYIFYFTYDAFHNGAEGERNLIDSLIKNVGKSGWANKLFNNFVIEEKEKKKFIPQKVFTSIDDMIRNLDIEEEDLINEMISKVDIKRIMNLVNANIDQHEQIKERATVDSIKTWLRDWAKSKYKFYVLFDNELYIKTTVEYEKQELDLQRQLVELYHMYPKYALTLNTFATDDYLNNKISDRDYSSLREYCEIKKGMKLSKFLSSLLQDEKFDIDLSKILQDKCIKQNLYISIDPYDYLTSAITKSGWRSCHHFVTGEHAAGCASYMFDESTLVAYMCHDKEYEYVIGKRKFGGNSKNWRQLIFVNTQENRCIFSREYPQHYSNAFVAEKTRKLLEENICRFCDIDDYWMVSHNKEEYDVDYTYPYHMAYNDIPHQYTTTIKHILQKKIYTPTIIGAKVKCPICNRNTNGNRDSRIICNNCITGETLKCTTITLSGTPVWTNNIDYATLDSGFNVSSVVADRGTYRTTTTDRTTTTNSAIHSIRTDGSIPF